MKVALDTNVLAYAEGLNAGVLRDAALDLTDHLGWDTAVLPMQVLGELFNVLVIKAGWSRKDARAATLAWADAYPLVETSSSVMLAAADLATDHQLRIWDAVVLSASAEAGCRLLLSEDLQEGFTWRGVTVTNPFAVARNPLLEALLTQ